MNIFKKKIIEPQVEFVHDNELLNKLKQNKDELKKINPKEPMLRFTLNDFCLKIGYNRIPSHMELFEQFFHCVDMDYQRGLWNNCHRSEELDFVIQVLQNYRDEIYEKEDILRREKELRQEIKELERRLGIE